MILIYFNNFFPIRFVSSVTMYRVCGLRLVPNLGVRPAAGKNFYLRLKIEKMRLWFLLRSFCRHTAEVTAILRLWRTVQI